MGGVSCRRCPRQAYNLLLGEPLPDSRGGFHVGYLNDTQHPRLNDHQLAELVRQTAQMARDSGDVKGAIDLYMRVGGDENPTARTKAQTQVAKLLSLQLGKYLVPENPERPERRLRREQARLFDASRDNGDAAASDRMLQQQLEIMRLLLKLMEFFDFCRADKWQLANQRLASLDLIPPTKHKIAEFISRKDGRIIDGPWLAIRRSTRVGNALRETPWHAASPRHHAAPHRECRTAHVVPCWPPLPRSLPASGRCSQGRCASTWHTCCARRWRGSSTSPPSASAWPPSRVAPRAVRTSSSASTALRWVGWGASQRRCYRPRAS